MNNSNVFLKSELGRAEIKSQHLGILPREARTLLIMIDGKRTYQNYIDTLDKSKMFADFGGVKPIFELLLELEYIEVVEVNNTTLQMPITSQSQPTLLSSNTNSDITFDSKNPKEVIAIGRKSISSIFKSRVSDANYGTIRSDLAIYIEKNASPAEAWSYLLALEQCEDSSQVLMLAQEIQDTSIGNLPHGMSGFIKRIQR
ncbi:hypothetical protein [Psychrobacter immobilis]|uniref:hypothetical protein n=1 Tax=Psychrobacter immobilis TaxID=498 RepID=UPI001918D6EB|nr:hypothetical protein [Psychrobacter immobilis]